jgi:dTDP-L-rhamnose 4-epimerase
MKTLVTGGAGLIGSHLVDLLLSFGHEVTILDCLDAGTHPHGKPDWIPAGARFIEGDVRNPADLRESLDDIDWVFHQAAFGGFTTKISHYIDANATGTARIYEVIHEHALPVQKIVVASSQAVYGEGAHVCTEHGIQFPPHRGLAQFGRQQWELHCPVCSATMSAAPTPQDAPHNGETPYALSKLVEERLSISMGRRYGIPTAALRYAVTYGPRQSLFNPYTGVVSIFSTRLLNGLAPVLYEDGMQTRDFVYVGDVARANLFAMENAATNYRAFNVGSGRPCTMSELALMLTNSYDQDLPPLMRGEFRPGDARHMVPDVSQLAGLGFRAETTIKEGLEHYVDWIRTQGDIREYFSEAESRLRVVGVIQGTPGTAG